jgi:hypothetical protein
VGVLPGMDLEEPAGAVGAVESGRPHGMAVGVFEVAVGSYTSMSSATGRTLYLADNGGIEHLNVKTLTFTQLPVSANLPPWDFVQVVAIDDRRAVAVYNKNGRGYVIERAQAGGPRGSARVDWVDLTSPLGQPELQRIEIDVQSNPLRMWVATKGSNQLSSHVYETLDGATSWHELAGLPPNVASDLRLGPRLSGTEQYLYLATWGRSVFQTNVG